MGTKASAARASRASRRPYPAKEYSATCAPQLLDVWPRRLGRTANDRGILVLFHRTHAAHLAQARGTGSKRPRQPLGGVDQRCAGHELPKRPSHVLLPLYEFILSGVENSKKSENPARRDLGVLDCGWIVGGATSDPGELRASRAVRAALAGAQATHALSWGA